MFVAAIIAVLAVSAANADRFESSISSEVILAKYSPRTNYEIEKICEFAEQQNYKNQNEDLSDEAYGSRSVHGGVQPDPKTKHQIQRCCNKLSQFEKKQCLKDVRENFLDKQCDIYAIKHMCCKTTGESRYTCFTKNVVDRPWPSSGRNNRNRAVPSPFELHDEVAGPWVSAEERLRRQSPREQDVERLRRELREPQRRKSWAAADQGEEDDEGAARFTYRERVEDQQARRQAGQIPDDIEEERHSWDQDRAAPSRLVDAIREIERIREQRIFAQQPERFDNSGDLLEFEADRTHEWERRQQQQQYQEEERQGWAQPEKDDDQDISESQQRRDAWEARESAEAERRRDRDETEVERVARQARWAAGGSDEEPWTAIERLASQVHVQEQDRARRQVYQDQLQQARRDVRRSAGAENFEDEPIDIIEQMKQFGRRFESDSESDIEGRPLRRQSRQHGEIEAATNVAIRQACYKNARRDGRNVPETCCEAGSLVGEIAGRRHGGQVCVRAAHKFLSEVRGCGATSHKPQCKPAFVHCCRRRAQNAQRRDDVNSPAEHESW